MDHRQVIEENLYELSHKIELHDMLWGKLIDAEIVSHTEAVFIRVCINYANIGVDTGWYLNSTSCLRY